MRDDSRKTASQYVIRRSSETLCEWWTGKGWSEDENDALRYGHEPDVSVETLDESAKPVKVGEEY